MQLKQILPVCFLLLCAKCTKDDAPSHAGHTPEHKHAANQIYFTPRERQVAGVQTDTVKLTSISASASILGIAAIDENKKQVISARVYGRIDRLFVRNPGEQLIPGKPLYAIYSEELLAEQNTYLLALQNSSPAGKQIAEAAQNMLLLWGMTQKQIADLKKTRNSSAQLIIYCPVNGILTGAFINEGQYVSAGMPLFEIADLSAIWIEAQVYPGETGNIKMNDEAIISFPDFPGEQFTGRAAFQNPSIEKNSKITLMRFYVDNKVGQIRPGMMAEINFGNDGKKTLVVPKSSILAEKEKAVWVEVSDGLYEKRMVMTGIENKKQVEITMGLKAGDRVVVAGSYLINSEFILRNGANSMGGMKM